MSAGLAVGPEATLHEMGYRGGGVTPMRQADGSIRYRARIYFAGGEVPGGVWESEALAYAAVEKLRERLAADAGLAPIRETLRTYGPRWLRRREERGRVRGVAEERSHWRHVEAAAFVDLPLEELTRGMVVRWVKERLHEGRRTKVTRCKDERGEWVIEREETGKPLSRGTVKHALRVLRACLREARDEELLEGDPTAGVNVPRVDDSTPKWTWLRPAEIDRLLAPELAAPIRRLHVPRGEDLAPHVDEAARLLWTVAVYAGLRKGELAGLRWGDVRFEARPYLHVCRSYRRATKSGHDREVPLLPPARAALERVRELAGDVVGDGTPVWPSASGGVRASWWDPGGWTKRGPRVLARHVRFHDLRHTCASHLVQGTWGRALSLYEVAQWLGHRDLKTTQKYAHLAPEGLHGLAAAMASGWGEPAESSANRHGTGTPARPVGPKKR